MTSLDFNTLNQTTKDQLAVTLAAMILQDDKSDMTAESLNRVLKAAGVEVAPYWPTLIAKSLEGKNLADLAVGGGSGPAPAQAAVAGDDSKKGDKKKEERKVEEPKVEEEEVDMDMGDLFG